MKKIARFDWQNFYSENNAKIIEKILDNRITNPEELFNLFFPINKNCVPHFNFQSKLINNIDVLLGYLNKKFKKWNEELLPKIEKEEMVLCPYSELLANANEIVKKAKIEFFGETEKTIKLKILGKFNESITSNTSLNSNQTLATLIRDNILPQELCRLPRIDQNHLKLIPNYYQQCSTKIIVPNEAQQIIKSPMNFDKTPITIEYNELLRLLEKHNRLKSEIEIACKEGSLGAYLRVNEEDIEIECLSKHAFQSIEYFRRFNCGNPNYTKRYEGLERLYIEKEDSSIYGENSNLFLQQLWRTDSSSLLFETSTISFISGNYVQSTDLETKFHFKRTLKSFNGKKQITIYDLVFIKSEIDIFLGITNFIPKQLNNQYFNVLSVLCQIGEEMERLPNTYMDKNENSLRDTIIVALKTKFDNVTGETYNKKGKTDILITYEKKTICIAECKFWAGKAAHFKTINQLLSYLTSFDNAAATIIYFSKNKNFIPVLNEIDTLTSKHLCFSNTQNKYHDRCFNYQFFLPDDKTITVNLVILVFNFNEEKNSLQTPS